MELLPNDLVNIVIDYKSQLEHVERYKKSMEQIRNINYLISKENKRSYRWKSNLIYLVEYFCKDSTGEVMNEKSEWYNFIRVD